MPKKHLVRTLRDSEHVKGSETLLKSSRQYFTNIFLALREKINSKISVIVVSEILRLFFNTFTTMKCIVSQKKRVFNASNSNAIIWKSKNICWVFFYICGFYIKFKTLWKKNEPQRLFVSEIIDCKNRTYLNAQKAPCKNTYGKARY